MKSIVRSLVNAQVNLENGYIKFISTGSSYEVSKITENNDSTINVYFNDGMAKNLDKNAFEMYNISIEKAAADVVKPTATSETAEANTVKKDTTTKTTDQE